MSLPRFDLLCVLSEYRPTENEIFSLYTVTKTFDHSFVWEYYVDWAESKTFNEILDYYTQAIVIL